MRKIFLLCLLSIVYGQWSFAAIVSEPVDYSENGEALRGYVYFDDAQKLNKIVYFHIGLSAPLILRTLATTLPEVIRASNSGKEE